MPDDNCQLVGLSGFRTAVRVYLDLYSSERKEIKEAHDFRRILRIWDENTYKVTSAIPSARKALRATGYPVPDEWRVRPVRPDVGIIAKDDDGCRVIRTAAIPAVLRKRFERIADAIEIAMGRIEDGDHPIAETTNRNTNEGAGAAYLRIHGPIPKALHESIAKKLLASAPEITRRRKAANAELVDYGYSPINSLDDLLDLAAQVGIPASDVGTMNWTDIQREAIARVRRKVHDAAIERLANTVLDGKKNGNRGGTKHGGNTGQSTQSRGGRPRKPQADELGQYIDRMFAKKAVKKSVAGRLPSISSLRESFKVPSRFSDNAIRKRIKRRLGAA